MTTGQSIGYYLFFAIGLTGSVAVILFVAIQLIGWVVDSVLRLTGHGDQLADDQDAAAPALTDHATDHLTVASNHRGYGR